MVFDWSHREEKSNCNKKNNIILYSLLFEINLNIIQLPNTSNKNGTKLQLL